MYLESVYQWHSGDEDGIGGNSRNVVILVLLCEFGERWNCRHGVASFWNCLPRLEFWIHGRYKQCWVVDVRQLGFGHRYLDCWYAIWEDYIVHKEFMMMTEIYSFNQQMDDTYDISHGDWVSACCSLWWRLRRHCFTPVSLVLTRSVRSVGIAQAKC